MTDGMERVIKTCYCFLGQNNFFVTPTDVDLFVTRFQKEMLAGLTGRESSLEMIPAYVSLTMRTILVDTPVMVLDAGGTNFRSCLVSFDRAGRPRIDGYRELQMPGTTGKMTKEEFFRALADPIYALQGKTGSVLLGFCFSYPATITPERDGKLLYWTKEIDVPEAVGCLVGEGIVEAFSSWTYNPVLKVSVLNDTVATLMAGAGTARPYSAYYGLILGTGVNMAYEEQNWRIPKVPGLPKDGTMVINMEFGGFDGVSRSKFDEILDASLADSGTHQFEKMISGAYQGLLALVVMKEAAKAGLFSSEAAEAILGLQDLGTADFDNFVYNPFLEGTVLDGVPMTDGDRRVFVILGTAILRRAAYLAGVGVAAVVLHGGGGKDPLYPVCITVDGSVFYKTKSAHFRSLIEEYLRYVLSPYGIYFDLVTVENAPIIGAAVAGLSAV